MASRHSRASDFRPDLPGDTALLEHPKNRLSLHNFRVRLSEADVLPQLTLLGVIIGLVASALLIGFRELLTLISSLVLPADEEDFKALSHLQRFFLPIAGSIVIIALIKACPPKRRATGVAHVIEQLNLNKGRLHARNIYLQFFGAITALATGFSVGREGPAVHLGAGAGSRLGQALKLPDNTLYTLTGCGVAAAISASFNTPLAGVVFAMEVIVREFRLGSFIPVMASSVFAALVTQFMYGQAPAFTLPAIPLPPLQELGMATIMAVSIGLLASLFIKLQTTILAKRNGRITAPILLAGILMGAVGALIPETMGIGYDTLTQILHGESFTLSFLLMLLVAKLVLTAVVTGLGVPGGIIGPSLFIGAITGAAFGLMGDMLLGLPNEHTTFHTLLGMVAMMAAVLQAPLVALVTVLELTRNPNIIMPAMLTIVIACLISARFFKNRGIFDMQLAQGGLSVNHSLLDQVLSRTGVASLMDEVDPDHSHDLDAHPHITLRATLLEASALMNQHQVSHLYVFTASKKNKTLCGVITLEAIEAHYH